MKDTPQKGYKAIMAAHKAIVANAGPYKHNREPKRVPFNTEPNGPYFKDRALNRDPHSPFGGKDQ